MATRGARDALEPYSQAYFRWDNSTDPLISVQPPISSAANHDGNNQGDENLDLRADRIRNWVASFLVKEFCKPESPAHYRRGDVVWRSNFDIDFSYQQGYDRPTIYVRTDSPYRLDLPAGLPLRLFPPSLGALVRKHIETVKKQWLKDHSAQLKKVIGEANLPRNITKVVCFGLGSIVWDPRFEEIRPPSSGDELNKQYEKAQLLIHDNYRNHIVASELARLLGARATTGRGVKVYCHDIRYTAGDRSLLRDNFEMTVLPQGDLTYSDDMALAHVDDNTFVYCTEDGYGLSSVLAGYCRPAGMICPFIDTNVPEAGYTGRATRSSLGLGHMFGPAQFRKHTTQRLVDPCPAYLRGMLEEYDMTSLLKATEGPVHGGSAYQKLLEDKAIFPDIKRQYNEAKNAGNEADIELLKGRLDDIQLLAKGCAGHWGLALYARKNQA